jgi:hypothetical protein
VKTESNTSFANSSFNPLSGIFAVTPYLKIIKTKLHHSSLSFFKTINVCQNLSLKTLNYLLQRRFHISDQLIDLLIVKSSNADLNSRRILQRADFPLFQAQALMQVINVQFLRIGRAKPNSANLTLKNNPLPNPRRKPGSPSSPSAL